MEQKFKVIYLGKLQGDADANQIAPRFAEKFKISQDKATKILNANKEVVLHSGAEHVKAYKLKSALESLGLQIRLVRVQMINKTNNASSKLSINKTTSTAANVIKNPALPEVKEKSSDKKPSNKSDKAQVAANINPPKWDLEPIKQESDEIEDTVENEDETVAAKEEYVDLRVPSKVVEKKVVKADKVEVKKTDNDVQNEKQPSAIKGIIKQFGGVIVAGIVGILFLAKKFGLFKLLKIGGLMAAAAYAGYNPEEACMGNGDCEDAISGQIDNCWSASELDQYDWDDMSDDQFYELKPQVEENFIACFRYADSGERVLESPIELRFDLIDMCDMLSSPVSGCEGIVESQIKACYDSSQIIEPIKDSDYDYYSTMMTDMDYFISFYSCFKDNNGSMIFAEFVNEMNSVDMQEALQLLQDELEAQ